MKTPPQKYQVGNLVVATEDFWPYVKKGAIGMVMDVSCDEVCSVSGTVGLSPEDGGPHFELEWGYRALFDAETCPQGVRLDSLSPMRIVQ